jgi:predicted nucleic acid-binding protein
VYAVLTRLPLPLRLRPEQASHVWARAFPEPCWIDAAAAAALWSRLGELGLSGGATYDALVAAAAHANGRTLLTRDRRAERTYRAIEVNYQFVE